MDNKNFVVDVRGDEDIIAFMVALKTKGVEIVEDEIYKSVVDIRNDIIKSMRNTHRKFGTYYKVGKKRKGHKPSAPGFPPAINSGNLVNRIFVQRVVGGSWLYLENVIYSVYLEEGTKNMEARPFFEPAINRSNWQQRIKRRIIAERFAGRGLSE